MWRRFASYARYVALLGAALVLIALGAWLIAASLKPWIEVTGIIGLVLLALCVTMEPEQLKAALFGKRTRYGSNAVVMSVALFLIIALLNYLGTRYHLRWDMTEEKQFTLSDQTLQILDSVDEPVKVLLFYTPDNYYLEDAEDLIKEYTVRCPQLSYEIIDLDTDRVTALTYGISSDGTIILETGDKSQTVYGSYGVEEEDLTGALIKLMSNEVQGVYFLTGHGEMNPEVTDGTGYSTIADALAGENYTVSTFTFVLTDTIPSDMSVLVIAGPTEALTQDEVDLIGNYVDNGGGLLVLYEPGMSDPLLGLLQKYGVEIQDDLIVDLSYNYYGDIATPVVVEYDDHDITEDLVGLPSLFPTARAVQIMDTVPDGWSVSELFASSSDSWAETSYMSSTVGFDASTDTSGPLPMGVAIEPSTSDSGMGRIVVIGDSEFAGDNVLSSFTSGIGNTDIFLNAVSWLAQEDTLISIRSVELEDRSVVLTGPQARGIVYSSLLFAPIVVLLIGGYVWWKHR